MARTLEFDYTDALEKATRFFWKLGYAGTSLRPLLKAMGIGEGSFYNTLKSMDHAYLECLKHHCATVGQRRGKALFFGNNGKSGSAALFNETTQLFGQSPHAVESLFFSYGSQPDSRRSWRNPSLKKFIQERNIKDVRGHDCAVES